MANKTLAKAVVNQVAKGGSSMSQTIKSAVNSENVKCKVIDYSFIREREDDDKSDVIGIMLVVINDGVIAADPFCMISKACTPQSVKLTGNEYASIVRYVLAGIDKGYITADTFKEGLDVVVSNKIKLPIPASHLR